MGTSIAEKDRQSKKHLIMGTAGHIDHGKTALVKALTGIDCDTHKEEKQRGITIHLGFSHLQISPTCHIGIVDVPGHAAFIRTMVAGSSGIDFFLLVIAADSGVMPQTYEHLRILQILGIRSGIIAITKIDLVEPDILEIAREEIQEFKKNSSIENCPVVEVSSRTNEGISALKELIAKQVNGVKQRPMGQIFRMFIDRIFTVKGFGTVVTGSVIGGFIKKGSPAFLLPKGNGLRVRRLEQYGKERDMIVAGDRASINLVGLNYSDFQRGMIISDRVLRSTTMLDAKLSLFKKSQDLVIWSLVNFYLGTYEAQARVHLIDRNRALGGETVLVQIHLPVPCIAQARDKFVIRSSSSDITLGGGEIIDAFPLHHKRRPKKVLENMKRIAKGTLSELIAAEVCKRIMAVSCKFIADVLNLSEEEIMVAASKGIPCEIVQYTINGRVYLLKKEEKERWIEIALRTIATFHKRNPLNPQGKTTGDILGAIGVTGNEASELVLGEILENLVQDKRLKKVGNTWALKEYSVTISPELKGQIQAVETFLKNSKMKTPLISELIKATTSTGLNEKTLMQILKHLVSKGDVYYVEGSYFHAAIVDECRKKLLRELAFSKEGITVAQFRDLVKGNRKICLLLLAIYDNEGVTLRKGDVRAITEKGRSVL